MRRSWAQRPVNSVLLLTCAHLQTTPGCNEVVRWTVFKEPVSITSATMAKMQLWLANVSEETDEGTVTNGYRTNNRFVQPLNGRTVWSSKE